MLIWSLIDRSNDALAICPGRNGVVKLAIRILSVIANSGGPERVFSDFGSVHTKIRNRLSGDAVGKMTTVRMSIRREHAAAGIVPQRLKRKLGLDYEPDSTPTPTSGASIGLSDAIDDAGDFRLLQEQLISEAIDSLAPEEDTEDDSEVVDSNMPIDSGSEGRGNAQLAEPSSHPGPLLLSADDAIPSRLLSRTSQRSGSSRRPVVPALHVPLRQLFLYPSRTPSTTPIPSTRSLPTTTESESAGSKRDAELCQRFESLWRGGVRAHKYETDVIELLHAEAYS